MQYAIYTAQMFTTVGSSSSFMVASFLTSATRWANLQVEIVSWNFQSRISVVLYQQSLSNSYLYISFFNRQSCYHGSHTISTQTLAMKFNTCFIVKIRDNCNFDIPVSQYVGHHWVSVWNMGTRLFRESYNNLEYNTSPFNDIYYFAFNNLFEMV